MEVFAHKPKLKKPDLYSLDQNAAFAPTPRAFLLIQEFFEMAGEVLPLPYGHETLSVLHVTECVDCLDPKKTRWIRDEKKRPIAVDDLGHPDAYQFIPDLLPESSIFKAPQGAAGGTFCWEEADD